MQYALPEVKGGVVQSLPVHVVQSPRARLPNSGAYIHMVALSTVSTSCPQLVRPTETQHARNIPSIHDTMTLGPNRLRGIPSHCDCQC